MHVDSTGKNIAYLSKPCLSNERSGNSGGQRVYAWNVKMARNYPSPLENCLQLKTKLLMFILTMGHFFDDNIYSIVTRYYWKKMWKKLTRTWLVTRTWLGLELDSCYDQSLMGEHLLKVTEISTSYDVKTCITTVTVPFEVWTFHNSLVVDSARWKHVPIYAFCEKNPRKNAVTQIVRTLFAAYFNMN